MYRGRKRTSPSRRPAAASCPDQRHRLHHLCRRPVAQRAAHHLGLRQLGQGRVRDGLRTGRAQGGTAACKCPPMRACVRTNKYTRCWSPRVAGAAAWRTPHARTRGVRSGAHAHLHQRIQVLRAQAVRVALGDPAPSRLARVQGQLVHAQALQQQWGAGSSGRIDYGTSSSRGHWHSRAATAGCRPSMRCTSRGNTHTTDPHAGQPLTTT